MIEQYFIVDLDNCIADDSWRIPRINWQKSNPMDRYHDYHSLSAFDATGNMDIFAEHAQAECIVFTARPTAYAAVTREWLRRNGIVVKHLLMRNNNDHRHSLDLKRTMLGWLEDAYEVPLNRVVAAYDDRADVVEMYRSKGIPAFRREIHKFCAYNPPHKDQQ